MQRCTAQCRVVVVHHARSRLTWVDPLPFLAAGASLTRDDSRNHALYGEDVLAADVIAGRVPPPKEVRSREG